MFGIKYYLMFPQTDFKFPIQYMQTTCLMIFIYLNVTIIKMNFEKGVNTKYINNLILTVSNSIDFIMLKNNEIILTLNKKEQAINSKECVNVF